LRIDRRDYRATFGTDSVDDFPREFEALEWEGLIAVSDEAVEPTELGMFYADSIAGLLSWRRHGRAGREHESDSRLPQVSHGRGDDNAYGHV
jgi:oxygen-independent coproporphyrinogen-3 oxidase